MAEKWVLLTRISVSSDIYRYFFSVGHEIKGTIDLKYIYIDRQPRLEWIKDWMRSYKQRVREDRRHDIIDNLVF